MTEECVKENSSERVPLANMRKMDFKTALKEGSSKPG